MPASQAATLSWLAKTNFQSATLIWLAKPANQPDSQPAKKPASEQAIFHSHSHFKPAGKAKLQSSHIMLAGTAI